MRRHSGYAEQRFDSIARPWGRIIIHFEALVLTSAVITRERQPVSRDRRGASNAVDMLNTESMLQLGMAADACQIVVRFIRFLDKACFVISALIGHLTDLFKHGGRGLHSTHACPDLQATHQATQLWPLA